MENLLIEIYLFVCHVYDTSSATCFQRLSNNRVPEFTDQEFITIWFFAHVQGCFEKKKMRRLIENYWREWLPHLPSYQTFVLRLNRLEPTFQTFGAVLSGTLAAQGRSEIDHLVDSLPVMLARARTFLRRTGAKWPMSETRAAKKTRFHGVRLHVCCATADRALTAPESRVPVCRLAS